MGALSTANLGGAGVDRTRCACGAWYDKLGDDGRGSWIDHGRGMVATGGYCRDCAFARVLAGRSPLSPQAAREVYDELSASEAVRGACGAPRPDSTPTDPPAPAGRRRRRSDIGL